MEKTHFKRWIDKYFKGIVIHVVETINGRNSETLEYLFKKMLRNEYSVSGKWETVNVLSSRVSADFVALDSSLPIKMRDSVGKVSGDIVKSGMELHLTESQIQDLNTMVALGKPDADIVAKLFADIPKVITGINELMERCFLEGLSSGVTVVDDAENSGLGVRMDYGYLNENKTGVKVLWSDSENAKPLDDLKRVLKKARQAGNTPTDVYMDDVTFDNFSASKQVKAFFAQSLKFANVADAQAPSLEDLNAAFKNNSNYRVTVHVVNRTIVTERNGKRKVVSPWSEGKVIFTCGTEVGVLSYATLAEETCPVEGVAYEKADGYILVSKFRQNRPFLAEFTTSQARVVPVICNVESIYQMDTKVVQA